MNPTRILVPAGALMALAPALALTAGPARAVAPTSLGVYFAESSAAPVGIVTRVPAESVGGLVFSSSSVRLGKAQAEAAGITTGPLGDAFVITSLPAGTDVTSVPTVVNAQDPPSKDAPNEARFDGSQEVGPVKGAVLTAHASDSPSAVSAATGVATDVVVIHCGASSSRSESGVRPDGTVFTTTEGRVQDITVGPAGLPALSIGSLNSKASVTIAPGGRPVTTLQVQMTGAQIAGVPVDITQDGVRVAGTVAVPPSSVSTVNAALAALGAHGLTITAVPTVRTSDAHSATVSGAALQLRYQLPDSVPRPTDIGADETFQLGKVSASADARPRIPLSFRGLPSDPAPDGPIGIPPLGEQPSSPLGAVTAPAAADVPPAADPVTAVAPSPGFLFPVRATSTVSDKLAASYRMFLLAALLGVGGLIAARRLTRTA